jgi:hypothetical protein
MRLHAQVDDWIASYERLWHFVGRFIGGDTSVVTFSGPGSPPPRRQRIRRFFELNAGIIAACYQREDLCTLLDFTQPGVEDSFVRCVRSPFSDSRRNSFCDMLHVRVCVFTISYLMCLAFRFIGKVPSSIPHNHNLNSGMAAMATPLPQPPPASASQYGTTSPMNPQHIDVVQHMTPLAFLEPGHHRRYALLNRVTDSTQRTI